jgi:hypothetical protein
LLSVFPIFYQREHGKKCQSANANESPPRGERREAWVVDCSDQGGKRRLKTFAKKRDAAAWSAKTRNEIGQGIHSTGPTTVAQAGQT